jgi:hypothetical protein
LTYWDNSEKKWVPLETENIDLVNDTITAKTSHFTSFAVLGYTPPPAEFTVSQPDVSPTSVETGKPVNVTVLVTNIGGTTGTYSVVLKINGIGETTQDVTLAAGGSTKIEFVLTKDTANTYNLDVNGQIASFTATELPAPLATTTETPVLPQVPAPTPIPPTISPAASNLTSTPALTLTPIPTPTFRLALLGEVIGITLVLIITTATIIYLRRRRLLRKG